MDVPSIKYYPQYISTRCILKDWFIIITAWWLLWMMRRVEPSDGEDEDQEVYAAASNLMRVKVNEWIKKERVKEPEATGRFSSFRSGFWCEMMSERVESGICLSWFLHCYFSREIVFRSDDGFSVLLMMTIIRMVMMVHNQTLILGVCGLQLSPVLTLKKEISSLERVTSRKRESRRHAAVAVFFFTPFSFFSNVWWTMFPHFLRRRGQEMMERSKMMRMGERNMLLFLEIKREIGWRVRVESGYVVRLPPVMRITRSKYTMRSKKRMIKSL